MNEVQLEVAKAYPNDSGHGIVRLDHDAITQLDAEPGDTVVIDDTSVTAATVRRLDRQDWDTGSVRIDGFTRQNLDIDLGEQITIEKTEPRDAEHIVFAVPKETNDEFDLTTVDHLKSQLLGQPVVADNLVPVMGSTDRPFLRPPGQAISLIAVETEPEGVVVITDDTTVELRDER